MMRHHCLLFLFYFGSLSSSIAQGHGLLIQQYSKASYDLEYYRKWNFDVLLQPHLSKPTNREAKGKLQLNLGGRVHYRMTKSFGLTSGVDFHRIKYKYAYESDNSVDHLNFLRLPLLLSVYPVKRLRLSLGGSYQFFLSATGQPPPATEPLPYPSRSFINSIGVMASAHFRVYRKFSASLGFHFQKRSSNPTDRLSQNFKGFSLVVAYTLLNPNQPKK
jgi:hypothetical protein